MTKKSDFTLAKARDISRDLEAHFGVIASPEAVRSWGLGLTLRGKYQHSKRYLIQKYLEQMHEDISIPERDIYAKYMSSQGRLRRERVPSFIGRF